MHSEFLYNMLHNDLGIGASQEGSVDKPIVVQRRRLPTLCCGSTTSKLYFTFWTNFTYSFSYLSAWTPFIARHHEQLIDILHISHMWQIRPGFDYEISKLGGHTLRPSKQLFFTQKYNIVAWVPEAVHSLLLQPFHAILKRISTTSHFLATWLLHAQRRKYWNSEGFWLQSLPIHPISMPTMLPTALTTAPVLCLVW